MCQHVHHYSGRITTESFQLIVPDASITRAWPILGGGRQLSDLIQQRLILPSPVLQDLVPEVINLLARSSRRVALFEFLGLATTSTQPVFPIARLQTC